MRNGRKLRVLDLFSGIGGFSLGLERTGGFETVAFCEIDPFCRKVLAKHWPSVPIHEDVRDLSINALGQINIIVGGFPCQDISRAGTRAGINGTRSGLWREIIRMVRVVRPRRIIVENVSALLLRGMGDVLGDLANAGFDAQWCRIRARDVGLPHIRSRILITANADGIRELQPGWGICDQRRRLCDSFQEEIWPLPDGGGDGSRDGLSARMGALGNAIIPEISELIGRAILEAEK